MADKLRTTIKAWQIKVLTVDQVHCNPENLKTLSCEGCDAPCCKMLTPYLSEDEFLSGKFAIKLKKPPDKMMSDIPPEERAVLDDVSVVVLATHSVHGCYYLGPDNECGIYDQRPIACRVYDCRGDPRMAEHVKKRFG